MTIKNDNWIIHQCTIPTHRFHEYSSDKTRLISPPYSLYQQQAIANWCPDSHQERFMRKEYAVPLSDAEKAAFKPMISPYLPFLVRERTGGEGSPETKAISYGVSSYGYDVRLAEEFKIFTNINSAVIDPKRFNDKCLIDGEVHSDEYGDKYVILPPNSYLLGRTIEYFNIPRDVMVVCLGKSTYARAGAIVNVTPIEAGFEGHVVIEVSNSTNLPLKIYANEGIAQFLFFQSDEPCVTSYADRGGKYQGQTGIVVPRI